MVIVMKKVVKFGGSSLASAEQFKKVGNIIHADAERRYVIPSAPGKRFSKDTKVTDMLYGCYHLAEEDKDFKKELADIAARYQEIIDGLGLTISLKEEFKTIEKNFKEKAGENEGTAEEEEGRRVIIRPIRSGKGVVLIAESFESETASELCDFYEKKIRSL